MIEFIRFYKHCSTTLLFHFSFLVVLLSNSLNFLIRFTLAYSESVYPVGDKAFWNIPPHVASFVCHPPSTRYPSGRRKKKKIPSSWEYGKYRPISKPSPKSYKCSRCGQKGHSKGSCVVPI